MSVQTHTNRTMLDAIRDLPDVPTSLVMVPTSSQLNPSARAFCPCASFHPDTDILHTCGLPSRLTDTSLPVYMSDMEDPHGNGFMAKQISNPKICCCFATRPYATENASASNDVIMQTYYDRYLYCTVPKCNYNAQRLVLWNPTVSSAVLTSESHFKKALTCKACPCGVFPDDNYNPADETAEWFTCVLGHHWHPKYKLMLRSLCPHCNSTELLLELAAWHSEATRVPLPGFMSMYLNAHTPSARVQDIVRPGRIRNFENPHVSYRSPPRLGCMQPNLQVARLNQQDDGLFAEDVSILASRATPHSPGIPIDELRQFIRLSNPDLQLTRKELQEISNELRYNSLFPLLYSVSCNVCADCRLLTSTALGLAVVSSKYSLGKVFGYLAAYDCRCGKK